MLFIHSQIFNDDERRFPFTFPFFSERIYFKQPHSYTASCLVFHFGMILYVLKCLTLILYHHFDEKHFSLHQQCDGIITWILYISSSGSSLNPYKVTLWHLTNNIHSLLSSADKTVHTVSTNLSTIYCTVWIIKSACLLWWQHRKCTKPLTFSAVQSTKIPTNL